MLRTVPPLVLLLAILALTARGGELGEDLLAAAKRGDADAVKALLAKGADVNAKNSYGATALSYAADKGHIEVVKLLLQNKADVNAKDTFYKASPLDWAVMRSHVEIIKVLVEAGAEGTESALVSAATQGQTDLVQAILDKGKLKEESLTKALAATPAKHTAVAELLTKAGAKPPKKTEPAVAPEVLSAYAGNYRGEAIDLKVAVEEGQLSIQVGGGTAIKLEAIDKTSFKNGDG